MNSIDALLDIVNHSVADIKAVYRAEGVSLPSLDEPYVPSSAEFKAIKSTDLAVAAALQLIAVLRPPTLSLMQIGFSSTEVAALGVANDLNVAEILREAGSEGLHVHDIAKKAQTNSDKLGRMLRVLASSHVFKEVSPNVFANNRLSSLLDTGHSSEEIIINPARKHQDTNGFPSLIGHMTHEAFKTAAFTSDHFADKVAIDSDEPNVTPMNRGLATEGTFMDYLVAPANIIPRARLNAAQAGSMKMFPPEAILGHFPWSNLEKGSLVVDVGGGVGSTSMIIAKQHPDLRFIVQDLGGMVNDGREYWQNRYPSALENGQVTLQVHSFFDPQPIKNASVFLLRTVLHDWPASYCKTILRHLRHAAQPYTKTVIVDQVLTYAVASNKAKTTTFGIAGEEVPSAPYPLLPNAGSFGYRFDILMGGLANGSERTVGAWVDVVESTGWKITEIVSGGSGHSSLILIPV